MNATIFVIREWESIEYHFAVEVGLDAAGDVEALVGEDVPERYWTTRYGGLELEETGYLKYAQGEEIELEDDELDEAREAIADMESAWDQERERLKDILRPEHGIGRPWNVDEPAAHDDEFSAPEGAPFGERHLSIWPEDDEDDQVA